jgi:DNA adenine methylase
MGTLGTIHQAHLGLTMRHPSPFRYPGGKTSLAPFLAEVIRTNGLEGGVYAEPFAGGAGAALKLLFYEVVSKLYINDRDQRIYSFWQAILNQTDEFIKLVENTPLTVRQWRKQKSILQANRRHSILEIGFATFFLNRCNRSGVLNGGPIGGLDQTGNYKIDARFNKKELQRKIEKIALYRDRITVKQMDAVSFLSWLFSKGAVNPERAFVYMDPPYFEKAARLYRIYFRDSDHTALAAFLNQWHTFRWIISYDDTSYIRKLYRDRLTVFLMKYSVHTTKTGRELIISSPNCALPPTLLGSHLAGRLEAVPS